MTAEKRRRLAKRPCETCGGLISPKAVQCRPCWLAERAEKRERSKVCPYCGGERSRQAERCLRCHFKALEQYRQERPIYNGVVWNFDPRQLQAQMRRARLGTGELGRIAKVSGVSIRRWLNGTRRPRTEEYRRVCEVLQNTELRTCPTCCGVGHVVADRQERAG